MLIWSRSQITVSIKIVYKLLVSVSSVYCSNCKSVIWNVSLGFWMIGYWVYQWRNIFQPNEVYSAARSSTCRPTVYCRVQHRSSGYYILCKLTEMLPQWILHMLKHFIITAKFMCIKTSIGAHAHKSNLI